MSEDFTAAKIREHFTETWRAHVEGCGFCSVVLHEYEREAAAIRANRRGSR